MRGATSQPNPDVEPYHDAGRGPSRRSGTGSAGQCQRSVMAAPAEESSARRVDTDRPTTVWGSPSTLVMNAPPRLSMVKEPAPAAAHR